MLIWCHVSCFPFSDGDLTIKKGEIVILLDQSNESRWKGLLNNKEGMFPPSILKKGSKRPLGTPPSSHVDTAKEHSEVESNTQNKKSKVQTLLSVSQNGKANDHSPTQSPRVQHSGARDTLSASCGLGENIVVISITSTSASDLNQSCTYLLPRQRF